MGSVSKKLFKGSMLRSFTLLVNILVGFFMMPFLIRSLGDDQYGIWVLVGAVIGFYGLLDAGFGGAIVRFIVRAMHSENNSKKDVNVALSTSIFLFSGVGLLSLLITGVIILMVPNFTDSDVNRSLVQILVAILGVKVSILFPLTSFGGVLVAKYRFDILSYIRLFSLVFRTTLIVIFVSYGYDIVAVAIITVVDALVVSISTVFFAKKLFPEIRVSVSSVSFDKLRAYYDFGKYTYITTVADRIRFSIDDLVVAAFIGVGAVTHYTIVVALIRYFGESMDGVMGVINPVLNKYHKLKQWDSLKEVFLVATEISSMISVLIGGLLIVLGEPFIVVWIGEEYKDVYIVLLILCPAIVIAQAQRPSVAVLYAIAKHKYYAKVTSIEAVANLFISVTLVQYIGIAGVAIGTAVPMMVTKVVLQPVYVCRQLEISLRDYYFMVMKYVLFGAIIFYIVYLIEDGLVVLDSYIELILTGGIVSCVYIVIAMKLIISDDAKRHIERMVPEMFRPIIRLLN